MAREGGGGGVAGGVGGKGVGWRWPRWLRIGFDLDSNNSPRGPALTTWKQRPQLVSIAFLAFLPPLLLVFAPSLCMTWGAGGLISSPTRDGEREKTLQVSRLVSRLRRPRGVAPLAYSHTLDIHDPAVQRPPVVLSDRLQGVGPVLEDDVRGPLRLAPLLEVNVKGLERSALPEELPEILVRDPKVQIGHKELHAVIHLVRRLVPGLGLGRGLELDIGQRLGALEIELSGNRTRFLSRTFPTICALLEMIFPCLFFVTFFLMVTVLTPVMAVAPPLVPLAFFFLPAAHSRVFQTPKQRKNVTLRSAMGALEIELSGNRTRFLSRTFRGGLCLGLRSSGRLLLVRLPVLFDHVVKRHPHTSLCVHTCQPTPTTRIQITSARVYSSLLCACCVRAIDFRLPSMPVVVGSIPLSSKSWSPARRASLPRFAERTTNCFSWFRPRP